MTPHITAVANRNYFGNVRYNKNAYDGDTIGAIEHSLQMMRVMKKDLGKSRIEVDVEYFIRNPLAGNRRINLRLTALVDPDDSQSAHKQIERTFSVQPVWQLEVDGG